MLNTYTYTDTVHLLQEYNDSHVNNNNINTNNNNNNNNDMYVYVYVE